MKDKKEYSSYQLSKRLISDYIAAHTKKIMWSFLCMILAAAATATNALLIEPVLDEIFVKQNRDLLLLIPLAILFIAVIKAVSVYCYSLWMKYIGQRIVTDMQIQLYEHLLYSDISLFNDKSSGNLISRFTNDIYVIRKNILQVLTSLINQLFTFIFLVGVLLYQSVELAVIGVAVFLFAVYPVVRLGKRMRKVSHSIQESLEDFTATLEDSFQGVRVVKSYNNEEYEVNKAKKSIEDIFKLYIKSAKIESISSPMMEMLAGLAIAAVIWYGGYQVLEGNTTPGSFFSFITALLMAYKPVKSLSSLNTNIQEGLAAVKRLFLVLDKQSEIKDKDNAIVLDAHGKNICLHNVSFAYKNTDMSALNDVNITVPSGKNVALVGHSGGGKSTIMNLILRFYDPTEGCVSIGEDDIRNVSLKSLRDNIAIVSQEATLFDTTIKENIRYGKHSASDQDVEEAAKLASAHEFILSQPNGYDTPIGQHGVKLSGGQRQRIAIARAMLANSPILLLDEATSALDTISEKEIQNALETLMKGRTTLVIAHRLSTIINSDLIYVIDKGNVVESGTHEQLLALNNVYAGLYHHQFDA